MKNLNNVAFMWGDMGVGAEQFEFITGTKAQLPRADNFWAYQEVSSWLAIEPACVSKSPEDLARTTQSLFAVQSIGSEAVLQVVSHAGLKPLSGQRVVGEVAAASWELVSVVSNPARRGEGYGEAVVDQAVRFFDENRSPSIFGEFLCVVCDSSQAAFYQKFGFGFSRMSPKTPIIGKRTEQAKADGKVTMTYNK